MEYETTHYIKCIYFFLFRIIRIHSTHNLSNVRQVKACGCWDDKQSGFHLCWFFTWQDVCSPGGGLWRREHRLPDEGAVEGLQCAVWNSGEAAGYDWARKGM